MIFESILENVKFIKYKIEQSYKYLNVYFILCKNMSTHFVLIFLGDGNAQYTGDWNCPCILTFLI